MDRILIIWEKEKKNGQRASSAPILGLFSVIFKHVYWYIQQISGEHLQDHWSSGLTISLLGNMKLIGLLSLLELICNIYPIIDNFKVNNTPVPEGSFVCTRGPEKIFP